MIPGATGLEVMAGEQMVKVRYLVITPMAWGADGQGALPSYHPYGMGSSG